MTLPVVLASLFGKLFARKPIINTPETMLGVGGKAINNKQEIFIPTISGGFITLPRQFAQSPFEKINNYLAQIHATISRSAITINSPLMRIWNMLERLFRTIFLPIELFLSSFLLPLLPILRMLLRLSMGTFLPMAITFFKTMMESKDSIAKFLTGEWLIELLFGKKEEQPSEIETTQEETTQGLEEITNPWAKTEEQTNETSQTSGEITNWWDEILNWLNGKNVFTNIQNFINNFESAFNSPFVTNIKDFVWNNMINPVLKYIGDFASPFKSPFVTNVSNFVWTNMINPVVNYISAFANAILNHPIVVGIRQFIWSNLIIPVINFVSDFARAILGHPIVVGIREFIWTNIVTPISNLILTIKNKFDEFKNNLPSPLNEIWQAISNLFNEIRNKINSFISSITFGIFGGGISLGTVTSGGGGGGSSRSGGSKGGSSPSYGPITILNAFQGGRPIARAFAYQHGGLIMEPVFGVGMLTGRQYTIAEKEPELVTPINQLKTNSGITININVNGNIIGITDFENRIKQIIEMELRRVK